MSFSRASTNRNPSFKKGTKRKSGPTIPEAQIKNDGRKGQTKTRILNGNKTINRNRRGSAFKPTGDVQTSIIYHLTRKPKVGVPAKFTVTIKLTGDAKYLDQQSQEKKLNPQQEIKLNKKDFGEQWKWNMRYHLLMKVKEKKGKPKWDIETKGDIEKYLKKNGITKEIKVTKVAGGKTYTPTLKDIFSNPNFKDELSNEEILGESLFLGLKF